MASNGLHEPLRRAPRRKVPRGWVDFLVQFRWVVVVPLVLPLSFAFQLVRDFRDWRSRRKPYARREAEHARAVEAVRARVCARDAARDGLLCTARKPWLAVAMRNSDYKRARRFEVDLSAFAQVLGVDTQRRVARVEPYVTMGQLSAVTVPMGWALEVVPELDDLTVGGLINGYGIEGSSHIYGLFSDTVEAYELVMADGELVRATRDNEHAELFYAVPWSQGTLGFLVAAEIRIIPVGEYMRLTYTPLHGSLSDIAQGYIDAFCPPDRDQDNPQKVPDFVEGLVYSSSEAVVMTGRYVSREEARKRGDKINNLGWWWKPWFYQHAETALKRGEFVESIPTRQYYHRHTRSLYWEGKLILSFADQFWFRLLLGWMMPPKVSFLKLTQGETIRKYYHDKHMCQDMLVPNHKIADALELCDQEYEVYPIWLCPHRLFKLPIKGMVGPEPGFELEGRQGDTQQAQMFTDIGVYYAPGPVLRGEEYDGAAAVDQMEKWLIENHSFQPQYAVTELTEQNFWKMFDGQLYWRVREQYGAVGNFMGVYYKSKKGKKTEKDVREEEAKTKETAIQDIESPAAP